MISSPLGAGYKQGDIVEFYQGTSETTFPTPLYTGTLTSDTASAVLEVDNITSPTATNNPSSFNFISVCPATGGIIIDGDTDDDGMVEIDGDGNIDGDGDIDMDGDGNIGGDLDVGGDLTGGGDLEFFGYTFDVIWDEDLAMTSARMFSTNREAQYFTLRSIDGTTSGLDQYVTQWQQDNGGFALGWTFGPKILISIDPTQTDARAFENGDTSGDLRIAATEANSYVYQVYSRITNPSGTQYGFAAVGSRGIDFSVSSGTEIVDVGGDLFGADLLPQMEGRAGGFGLVFINR